MHFKEKPKVLKKPTAEDRDDNMSRNIEYRISQSDFFMQEAQC